VPSNLLKTQDSLSSHIPLLLFSPYYFPGSLDQARFLFPWWLALIYNSWEEIPTRKLHSFVSDNIQNCSHVQGTNVFPIYACWNYCIHRHNLKWIKTNYCFPKKGLFSIYWWQNLIAHYKCIAILKYKSFWKFGF
jgi:hypothetical protein